MFIVYIRGGHKYLVMTMISFTFTVQESFTPIRCVHNKRVESRQFMTPCTVNTGTTSYFDDDDDDDVHNNKNKSNTNNSNNVLIVI
jgi:hypothetical protein